MRTYRVNGMAQTFDNAELTWRDVVVAAIITADAMEQALDALRPNEDVGFYVRWHPLMRVCLRRVKEGR